MMQHARSARLSYQLKKNMEKTSPGCSIEYVTDDLVLVMVVIEMKEGSEELAAWDMVLAIDALGAFLEERTKSPFATFVLLVKQAFAFVDARSHAKRKRDARW